MTSTQTFFNGFGSVLCFYSHADNQTQTQVQVQISQVHFFPDPPGWMGMCARENDFQEILLVSQQLP